jgi:phage major head subunit gpT-like protein
MSAKGFDDRNILGLYYAQYEERFQGSWANDVSLYNGDSDRAVEEYGLLGANPVMREWIGARQAGTINKNPYEIRNRKYESTLEIDGADLDRDKSGLLDANIGSFASDSGADHWENLLIDLINSNGLCYDGQNFFDTDHLWGDSGTQKNEVTATEIPAADVGTATAPTPTEAAAVILQMAGYMMTIKNDKGRAMNGQARNFLIAVSTVSLYSAVAQAVTANMLTGVTDNPLMGLRQQGFNFVPKLIPTLTSATAKVRMFRTDGALKPFILQDEKGMEVQLLGRGSDFYFDTGKIKLGVDARRGAGYGLWEHALSCTLS